MSNIQMAQPGPIGRGSDSAPSHYIDWAAILAGAILASAISFVILAFGAALGLSLADVGKRTGFQLTGYVIAIGLWLVWVHVSSVMAGGYIAGRMRRRLFDSTAHEVSVRDGVHGVLVWALAALIGAWLAGTALTATTKTAAGAVATAASVVTSGVTAGRNDSRSGEPLMEYALDALLRPDTGAQANVTVPPAAPNGQPATGGGQVSPSPQAGSRPLNFSPEARNAIVRTLGDTVASGTISESDKQYIASVVASQTGITREAAAQRVEAFIKQRNEIVATAAATAEKARKVGIIAAFITAVSLLLAAAAGWWTATMGGAHRDEETVLPLLVWIK